MSQPKIQDVGNNQNSDPQQLHRSKKKVRSLISKPTWFKIVGIETVAVGIFFLVTFLLNQMGQNFGRWLPSIGVDFPIIGGALILVGLETLSLVRNLPKESWENMRQAKSMK
jgi:hypothetical protein